MKKSLFITGTDTGVGKTFFTSSLVRALRCRGVDVGVMKPVETGCGEASGRLLPTDALALKDAAGAADPIDEINPYRFSEPVAPNLAARLSHLEIDTERIRAAYRNLAENHEVMLIEGAGGLLVPITDGYAFADLAADLGSPLVVVAPSRLGVINHVMLTVSAASSRGIPIKAVVLNYPAPAATEDRSLPYNRAEIERLTGLPVLELPFASPENIKTPFPEEGGLIELLLGL